MFYINKEVKGFYLELNKHLDASSNLVGESWDDYEKGYWVLLNDAQENFKKDNPNATVKEVFEMKKEEVSTPITNELDVLKEQKLSEIQAADDLSNKFYISTVKNGVEISKVSLWIDKDLRNSLYSITLPALKRDGNTTTKLWTNSEPPMSIEVPIDWALDKLPLLEVYAKETYDKKAENESAVYNAYNNGDLETLKNMDVFADYPLVRTFELNLDLNEQ